MGEKSFVVPLSDSDRDRYRLHCKTQGRRVVIFRVQYEAFIDGQWLPVVRYDTAHGFPHQDLLHPGGESEKSEYPGHSNAEVLTLGQEDIKRNWRAYRARYEEEMHK